MHTIKFAKFFQKKFGATNIILIIVNDTRCQIVRFTIWLLQARALTYARNEYE